MLQIFLIIAVSVATCERSCSKLKLIKNYVRSSIAPCGWEILPCCLCRATIDRRNKSWHCHWRICEQRGKKSCCVEKCSFHFRNKDGPYFHTFLLFFPICQFCFLFNCYLQGL